MVHHRYTKVHQRYTKYQEEKKSRNIHQNLIPSRVTIHQNYYIAMYPWYVMVHHMYLNNF